MAQNPTSNPGMRLHASDGTRLYLDERERAAFIAMCQDMPEPICSFSLLLVYSGCRLSEARHLTTADVLLTERSVCLRTLKRRSNTEYRYVPIPQALCDRLIMLRDSGDTDRPYLFSDRTFPPTRIEAYRWVKSVMGELGYTGPKATPKGLRHTFGAHAIIRGVQLQMLQRWMGHASMDTTAIYSTLIGKEEREIAKRMWD